MSPFENKIIGRIILPTHTELFRQVYLYFYNMADVHDKATRSYNMSQIKGKDTKPEILVRKFLFSKGFRYRLYDKKLPGKPDIVLPKYKTVIFIHGCFWHGHEGCKYFVIPKTRTDWWLDKINGNILKYSENELLLTEKGWKILLIWECKLKALKVAQTLSEIIKEITTSNSNQINN